MPECSNPIQCQTAKRTECTCGCGGANHGRLRLFLDSANEGERKAGEEMLKDLQQKQGALKKQKRKERRQKRTALRKAEKEAANT